MNNSELVFAQNQGIQQLCNASSLLINESITMIQSLELADATPKVLNSFANNLLSQIDNTYKFIDAVKGIPSTPIIEASILMQRSVDELYKTLTATHNEYQAQIYTPDSTFGDKAAYAKFCGDLALRLLHRASESAKTTESDLENVQLIFEMED